MGAGLPKYVTINLGQLSKFSEGEEVTLQSLEQKRIFSLSGREDRLPLKVHTCGLSHEGWQAAPAMASSWLDPTTRVCRLLWRQLLSAAFDLSLVSHRRKLRFGQHVTRRPFQHRR